MFTKKEKSCQNNSKNCYTEKKAKHEPSGWIMFTKCSFDATKNKLDYYRGKDCIKMLSKKLKDHALKIINYKEKEMIQLTDEENKFYEEQEICYIFKKSFVQIKLMKMRRMKMKMMKNLQNTKKSKIIVIIPGNLEELPIAFAI